MFDREDVKFDVRFSWNGRSCNWGTQFHVAILSGNFDTANNMYIGGGTAERPEGKHHINRRFRYHTTHGFDNIREGSGEPIHLAASMNDLGMVKWLLERNANINAMVTRDHQDHYNVLHAAVYAEGKGGTFDMVTYLLNHNPPATCKANGNGDTPLCTAFKVGAKSLIDVLRKEQKKAHFHTVKSLAAGFDAAKLSHAQLANLADVEEVEKTCRLFVINDPRCLDLYLERLHCEGPMDLARKTLATSIDL